MASKMSAAKKPGLNLGSKDSSGKNQKATSSSIGSKSNEYGCGGKNTKTTNSIFGKSGNNIEYGGKTNYACKNIKTSDVVKNVNASAKLSTAVGVSGKSCFNTSNPFVSSEKSSYVLDTGTKSSFGVGITSTPGITGKTNTTLNSVKSNSALEMIVKTNNTPGQNGIKYGVTPNLNEKSNSTSGNGNFNSNIFSYGITTYSFNKRDKIVNTPVVNRKSDNFGTFNGKSTPADGSGKFSSQGLSVSVGTSALNDKTKTSSCVGEHTSSIGNLTLRGKYFNSNVLNKSNSVQPNNEKGCDRSSNEEKRVYNIDTDNMYSTSQRNRKENTIVSNNAVSKNIINKDKQSIVHQDGQQNQNKNLINVTDSKMYTNHIENPSPEIISKSKHKLNEKSLLITSGVAAITSNKTVKSDNGSRISFTPSTNLNKSTSISNLKTLPSSANLKKSHNISNATSIENITINTKQCCNVSNTDTKKLKDDKTYIDKSPPNLTSSSCKKSENLILTSSAKPESTNLKGNVNVETKLNPNSEVPSGEKVYAKFGTHSKSSMEVNNTKINMPLVKKPRKLDEHRKSDTVLVSSDVTSKNYSPTYSSLVAPKKKSSIGLGIIWIPGRRRNKKKDMVYQPHQAEYRRERSPSMYPIMSGDSPDNQALKNKEEDNKVIVPEKTKALLATAARDEVVLVNTAVPKLPEDNADNNQDEKKEFISREQREWEQSIDGAGDNNDNADRNNTKKDSEDYLEDNEKINKSSNNIFKDSKHEDKVDSVYLRRPPPHKVRSNVSTPAVAEDEDGCGIKCLYYTVQCCDCVLM